MSFREVVAADRRLVILRLLVEDGGTSNESVLEKGLEALGHNTGLTRQAVREYMRELETLGCVTLAYFNDRILVASLTDRGHAAAKGNIAVDGIAQPSFGEG